MKESIELAVKDLLADYIEVTADNFCMSASLEMDYEVDSTELTELATKVERAFSVSVSKVERQGWETGDDICRFVQSALSRRAVWVPETAAS